MSEVIKALEAECFEKNVWKVCHKVASRIDGEPAPCGHMAVHATQRTGKCYYLLHVFLLENGDHAQHMMYTDHQLSTTFLLLISDEHFFWNSSYLEEFIKASESRRNDVPGQVYFRKLKNFIDAHCWLRAVLSM